MNKARRQFVGRFAAGGTMLGLTPFLASCGVSPLRFDVAEEPLNPFLNSFAIDESMISQVMRELTRKGADSAELYFQHKRSSVLQLAEGRSGTQQVTVIAGVGMRVVIGSASGFAYTEELTLPGMLAAAKAAVSMIGSEATVERVPTESYRWVEPEAMYDQHLDMEQINAAALRQRLRRIDSAVRAADPSINDVQLRWSDSDERVVIATLDGRLLADRRPLSRLSAQAVAEQGGQVVSGFASLSARAGLDWYTDERLADLGGRASERTLIQFDARQAPTGDLPVILTAGSSGVVLHEAIGHSFEADYVQSGDSRYAGQHGERVAADIVSIVDEATIPNERGALSVDDEGTVCGRTPLVENGRLTSLLHDSVTARQFSVASTGSARRESFMHQPTPRMSCTFMENGPHTREEIVETVQRGIIAETYTGGQVQLGGGDFRFNVKNAWLVENGKITMPLRDLQIAGNGAEVLRDISMVADDSRLAAGGWTCGKRGQRVPVSLGMPTVLVPQMKVQPDA
ncbi:MAG: TldD/PmbA family protein [Woeseia sp.]